MQSIVTMGSRSGWVDVMLTNRGAHMYNGNTATGGQNLGSRDNIVDLIGPIGTDIPDDVITSAINVMRIHDVNNNFAIGDFTPAAQVAALQENKPYYLTEEKTSINIIHLHGHWVTVIRESDTGKVLLLDSLRYSQRPQQVLPILKLMYRNMNSNSIEYPVLAQQPEYDPACGVYAIAFAFSYMLRRKLEDENYSEKEMRPHLRSCVINKVVIPFPTRTIPMSEENRNEEGNSIKVIDIDHQPARSNIEEKRMDTESERIKQSKPENKENEKNWYTERKRNARQYPEIIANEQQKDSDERKMVRFDPGFRI